MTTLTLVPGGEAPDTENRFATRCPNSLHVIVHDQEVAVESHCGRYLEWLESHDADSIVDLLAGVTWADKPDGLYIVEGHVVMHAATETEDREAEWVLDQVRALTTEEWQRYRDGDEVWPESYFNPDWKPSFVPGRSEGLALFDAGQGWLEWRRNIEIDLSRAEIDLATALLALMDEDAHADTTLFDRCR